MARIIITGPLKKQIFKKFKNESNQVFNLIYSLKENPKKGKELGNISNFVLKELKYKSFRIYFITDGFKLKFLEVEELKDLVIKFVRMSDKKSQQKTIDEIKHILRSLGSEGF